MSSSILHLLLRIQKSQCWQKPIFLPLTVKHLVSKPCSSSMLNASRSTNSVAFLRGLPQIPTTTAVIPPLPLPTAPTALSYPHLSSSHSLLPCSPLPFSSASPLLLPLLHAVKGKACPLPHNTPLNDRRMGIPLAVQSRSECSHTQGIPKRPPRHAGTFHRSQQLRKFS